MEPEDELNSKKGSEDAIKPIVVNIEAKCYGKGGVK
jgi:hypothetical protein